MEFFSIEQTNKNSLLFVFQQTEISQFSRILRYPAEENQISFFLVFLVVFAIQQLFAKFGLMSFLFTHPSNYSSISRLFLNKIVKFPGRQIASIFNKKISFTTLLVCVSHSPQSFQDLSYGSPAPFDQPKQAMV